MLRYRPYRALLVMFWSGLRLFYRLPLVEARVFTKLVTTEVEIFLVICATVSSQSYGTPP